MFISRRIFLDASIAASVSTAFGIPTVGAAAPISTELLPNIVLRVDKSNPPPVSNYVISNKTIAWFIHEEPNGLVHANWRYEIKGPCSVLSNSYYGIGNARYLDSTRMRLISFKFGSGTSTIKFTLMRQTTVPPLYAEIHASPNPSA
jgi:hypothetical protein